MRPHRRGRPAVLPPTASDGPPCPGFRGYPRFPRTATANRAQARAIAADATKVSIESTLARIAEISSALAPPQQQQAPPPSQGAGFQGALDGAMAQPGATASAAPAPGPVPASAPAAPGSYPHLN